MRKKMLRDNKTSHFIGYQLVVNLEIWRFEPLIEIRR